MGIKELVPHEQLMLRRRGRVKKTKKRGYVKKKRGRAASKIKHKKNMGAKKPKRRHAIRRAPHATGASSNEAT